jgi:hypothetical protein
MLLLRLQNTGEKVDPYSDRVSEKIQSPPEAIQRMSLDGETYLSILRRCKT